MASAYVTGVAGFLGSHVAQVLLDNGWTVAGCDNLITGQRRNIPDRVDFTEAPVQSLDRLPGDVVFHLAAVPRSMWPDPVEVWEHGYNATLHVASIVTGRWVFASSSVARHPEASTYACAKHNAERVAFRAGAVCLRYGNIWGAGQSQAGHAPNVVAQMAAAAASGAVWVDGDGTQTRDFVHVTDAAAATVAAAAAEPCVADVCTGVQTRIGDVASQFGVPVKHRPGRGDPHELIQDPEPAARLFGWRATRRGVDVDSVFAGPVR